MVTVQGTNANVQCANRIFSAACCFLILSSPALAASPMHILPAIALQQDASANSDSNEELFANFLHNAVIGKFKRADAYAQQLLKNAPDPISVLGYSEKYTNSMKTLILLIEKVQISESAQRILELIEEGERMQRQSPQRIQINIEKLGGDPQTEFNAINRLRDSGEYAIPWLVETLQNKAQSKLHNRVIRMLPKMGKAGVNPLVIALRMDNPELVQFIVKALGDIGYPQALPYLLAAAADGKLPDEVYESIHAALQTLQAKSASLMFESAPQSFLSLARQYYENHGSVKADPRVHFANVWYWRNNRLERTEVPTEIYDEIMTMRCCEEALRLDPTLEDAVALWLAANIRREAQLGMDVESVLPDNQATVDPTKPADYPRSTYFARSNGARYCHKVLDLAIQYDEPAVALGAISALRLIAGASNLVGMEDFKQPLSQALTFPDQQVRIKAALTLGNALPTEGFAGSDNVVPVLCEAISLPGGSYTLVIEPDEQNRNRVMNAVRSDRSNAAGAAQVLAGLDMARSDLPTVSAIFMATDVQEPSVAAAVETIRSNSSFALTPIILLTKEAQSDVATKLADADRGIVSVTAGAGDAELKRAWQAATAGVGLTQIDADESLALALDATETFRKIAFSRSVVYDFGKAESALISALNSQHEVLQVSAASVLALAGTSSAQHAIAMVALDPSRTESLRIAAFDSLAESAKVSGNMLPESATEQLITMAMDEPNLALRTAASQALGSLNITSDKASRLIDKFYRG